MYAGMYRRISNRCRGRGSTYSTAVGGEIERELFGSSSRDPQLARVLAERQELVNTFGGSDDEDDSSVDGERNGDVVGTNGDGDENRPVSQKQFHDLLAAVQKSSVTIASVQKEVIRSREETTETIEKRCKKERAYQFKQKGNRIQYEFNEDVLDKMESAETSIGRVADPSMKGPAKKELKKAQQALEEGKGLLIVRQKHIKMADRSDHGWATVAEYQEDELASDSEDEKKMERAERSAERKLAKSRKRKADSVNRARLKKRDYYSSPREVLSTPPSSSVRGRAAGPSGASRVGPCYNCQEWGHLKKDCPKPRVAEPIRWYPFNSSVTVTESRVKERVGSVNATCDLEVNSMPELDEEELNLRDWELEGQGSVSPLVKGGLRQHVVFWVEHLRAPTMVLSIISEGYKLPLLWGPPEFNKCNDPSAFENAQFVTESVRDLIASRCIEKVQSLPHICSPLLVVVNSVSKKRLVINLKFLNQYLLKQKFKYEDLRTALDMLTKDDFLFKFDLKSGYHHIDIHPEHTKYLGFEWGGSWYVFNVLPFGLASACFVFTKVLRPLVRYWRNMGIRMVLLMMVL